MATKENGECLTKGKGLMDKGNWNVDRITQNGMVARENGMVDKRKWNDGRTKMFDGTEQNGMVNTTKWDG